MVLVNSTLKLQIGAQVMLMHNLDDGLTNGTIGTIKGIDTYRVATGDQSYQKKIGFIHNIQVIEQGIPVSYPIANDSSSHIVKSFPLVEFYICHHTEHVLVLLMKF